MDRCRPECILRRRTLVGLLLIATSVSIAVAAAAITIMQSNPVSHRVTVVGAHITGTGFPATVSNGGSGSENWTITSTQPWIGYLYVWISNSTGNIDPWAFSISVNGTNDVGNWAGAPHHMPSPDGTTLEINDIGQTPVPGNTDAPFHFGTTSTFRYYVSFNNTIAAGTSYVIKLGLSTCGTPGC